MQLAGEKILMRIHVTEGDRHRGEAVYKAITRLLRQQQLAGATIFRGSMSFGADRVVHTDRIEVMSFDLPIVIECVDDASKIRAILPQLDSIIDGGVITLERAHVLLYRPDRTGTDE
jgi:PII-like signaling protein